MVTKSFAQATLLTTNNTIASTSLSGDIVLGPAEYNTVDDLPLSNNKVGYQAFVRSTNRLYIWSGQGWYSVALINTSPAFDSGGLPDASYELDSNSGTPITIQLSATDPEDLPIQWSYVASDSAQYFADITQDSSVFTITAKPTATIQQYDSAGGAFSITFKASDGINLATALSEFTIGFPVPVNWLSRSVTKIVPPGSTSQAFGSDVSLSADGTVAVIGARLYYDSIYGYVGATYVYRKIDSVWGLETVLIHNPLESGDQQGYQTDISADGNTIVTASQYSGDAGRGRAFVFEYNQISQTWSQQAELRSDEYNVNDNFGNSVSLSDDGNTLAVGGGYNDNYAYIFTRSGTTWTKQARLIGSNTFAADFPTQDDNFGYHVCLSGDGNTLVVNAERKPSFYIFTRSGTTWTETAELVSSHPNQFRYNDAFISNDGNTIIIGDDLARISGVGHGAAYVFAKSGSNWFEEAILMPNDIAADDYFGCSVSLSGDGNVAIIGAYADDGPNDDLTAAGSAYIFTRTGSNWSEVAKLYPDPLVASQAFGNRVYISDDGHTIICSEQGTPNSVYIFSTSN